MISFHQDRFVKAGLCMYYIYNENGLAGHMLIPINSSILAWLSPPEIDLELSH